MLVLQLGALNWEAGNKSSNNSNSDHMKLVQTVSHILSNLAVDPRNQQELLDAGAIPLLMRLIGELPRLLCAPEAYLSDSSTEYRPIELLPFLTR